MSHIKLKEYCDRNSISYITGYRWFKDKHIPGAYQTPSGTILIPDDYDCAKSVVESSPSSISEFIAKTIEFSNNGASIGDFASYILSNFSIKFTSEQEVPKYSKNKPKSEDIQKHFQQFMKKGEKPKANVYLEAADNETIDDLVAKADSLTAQELMEQIHEIGEHDGDSAVAPSAPELNDLLKALAPNSVNLTNPKVYGDIGQTEGLVSRTVDFNSTPQQINYTSSTDQTFGVVYNNTGTLASGANLDWSGTAVTTNTFFYANPETTLTNNVNTVGGLTLGDLNWGDAASSPAVFPTATAFQPTQKELTSAKLVKTVESLPRRQGRKPSKNKSQE